MQQTESIQLTLFGKMYQEHSVQIKEKTSEWYSKNLSKYASRMPRCLRLKKGSGHTQTYTWVTDGLLLTELLMHNIGESPNEGEDVTLSSVLEMNVPEKYYLSVKACEGILRRAERRGKQLPDVLKNALEQQIKRQNEKLYT